MPKPRITDGLGPNDGPWAVPSWILTQRFGYSPLFFSVNRNSCVPRFDNSMRPSYLTISFDKGIWEPHHLAVAWIKHCIDHLSFANHLQSA